MGKVVLQAIGPDKASIVNIVRDVTGMDLAEAEKIVDAVEQGSPYTFDNIPAEDSDKIVNAFLEKGAKAQSDGYNVMESEIKEYVPPFSADVVHKLDRNDTLTVLMEAGNIAKGYEQIQAELALLPRKIKVETEKAEALRNVISDSARALRLVVTVALFCVGLAGGLLCVVTGIAGYVFMTAKVVKADLKKHEAENNANADAYMKENVEPLQARLDALNVEKNDYENNGRIEWAKSIVGNEFFYSACIMDLYNLVDGHRADNLKEALNRYDDQLYKERMTEMQAAIQNASEVSAAESVKQTALDKRIAKSTGQAAAASMFTAANTRAIYKDMDKNKKK